MQDKITMLITSGPAPISGRELNDTTIHIGGGAIRHAGAGVPRVLGLRPGAEPLQELIEVAERLRRLVYREHPLGVFAEIRSGQSRGVVAPLEAVEIMIASSHARDDDGQPIYPGLEGQAEGQAEVFVIETQHGGLVTVMHRLLEEVRAAMIP